MKPLIIGENTLGHVTHLETLEEHALLRGIDVTVARLDPGEEAANAIAKRLYRNYSVQMSLRARKIAKDMGSQHDVVLIHTQTAGLLYPTNTRVPLVLSGDGTPKNYDDVALGYEHQVSAPWVESLKRKPLVRAYRNAAALVFFSRWAAESAIEHYGADPAKTHVIHPGSERVSEHRPLHAADDRPVRLLFIGGDFERKGGPELLRAAEGLPVEIDIVTRSTSVVPSPRISVHTDVRPKSDRLRQLLLRADIFVLPTTADMFSFASLEAMSAAIPVIATGVGGIAEIVEDGRTGILIPPSDPQQLRAAIERLVADPNERRQLGAAGFDRWQQSFEAQTQTTRLFDLLAEVTARR